ncbi:hypothetical protein BaRGS_00016665 [Batillaria attramentaria]|uniref:Uncharacterized protein n=1 Tax=Batillaria attramentaria TaxID=370345 RepID=A0ABD0KY42_9CAEN
MEGANMWLKSNPGLRVWKCETVERKVETGPIVHLDNTVHHESAFGVNVYVFGVRMWLTRRQDPKEPVQELGLLSVPPPIKEIPVAMAYGGYGAMMMGMHGGAMMGMPVMTMRFGRRRGRVAMVTHGTVQTYESLSKAVDNFNEVTQSDPLPGSILNVETTAVKFGSNSSEREADPDVTSWSENGGNFKMRRFTKILRVFYVKGPPKKESLKMQTFLPRVLREPQWNVAAQFEPFDTVLQNAQRWLQTQSGIRVVNIETRDAEYQSGFGQPVQIGHESTDDIVTGMKDRDLVRFLRVFYVTAPEMTSYANTTLTSRLFVPCPLGGRGRETMTQTMTRINAWLNVVGLPIFSVESVPYLMSGATSVNTDQCNYKHSTRTGNYWLTCVRLYFPTPFQEPPAHMLPAPPANSKSSSCVIL